MQLAVACRLRTVRTNAADQNTQFERAPRAKRNSPKDRWKALTTPRFYNVLSFDQPSQEIASALKEIAVSLSQISHGD